MKVYILEAVYDHEEGTIYGVYSSRPRAEELRQALLTNKNSGFERWVDIEILEFELDKEIT
jgi:hypothetical protein